MMLATSRHKEEGDREWECTLELEGEYKCGKEFRSKAALQAHQRMQGGGEHGLITAPQLVVTNECLFCRSAFKMRDTVKIHVGNSYMKGRCKECRAHMPRPAQEVEEIRCHICGKEFWNERMKEIL